MGKTRLLLSESELVDLIKLSLNEQNQLLMESYGNGSIDNPYTDSDLDADVSRIVNILDGTTGDNRGGFFRGFFTAGIGWTTENGVADLLKILRKYEPEPSNPNLGPWCEADRRGYIIGCLGRINELYSMEEGGDTLAGDLNSLWTSRFGTAGKSNVNRAIELAKEGQQMKPILPASLKTPPAPAPGTTPPANKPAYELDFSNEACMGRMTVSGEGDEAYGTVDYKGGKASFWLNGRDIAGDGFNIVVTDSKGNQWIGKGRCQKGGPTQSAGLVITNWNPYNKK